MKLSEMGFRSNLAYPCISKHWENWNKPLPKGLRQSFQKGAPRKIISFWKLSPGTKEKALIQQTGSILQVLLDFMAHHSSAATMSSLSGWHHPRGDGGGRGTPPAAPGSSRLWFYQLGCSWLLALCWNCGAADLGCLSTSQVSSGYISQLQLAVSHAEPGVLLGSLHFLVALRYPPFCFSVVFQPSECGRSDCRGHGAKHWCAAGARASRAPNLSFGILQAKDAGSKGNVTAKIADLQSGTFKCFFP